MSQDTGDFILYVSEDNELHVDVRVFENNVWLTQKQMAEMFQKNVSTINEHLKNIFEEGELDQNLTIRNFRIVQQEGERNIEREVQHYHLDAIIAVGYRVRSKRGTQFRIWAIKILREYIIKGFAMDDARLKQGNNHYFDELLTRIRDIRASEKLFYQKVLEIYATSVDYDPKSSNTIQFFQTVQNKMHWAAHGHTAAEIVFTRVDGTKPNLGMSNFVGTSHPKLKDATVAKNYLHEKEIDTLNRLVTMYLDFAEFQAQNQIQMHMKDWLDKLDQFLSFNGRDVLQHKGKISHQQAEQKAKAEFSTFKETYVNLQTAVERDFEQVIKNVNQIAKTQGKK